MGVDIPRGDVVPGQSPSIPRDGLGMDELDQPWIPRPSHTSLAHGRCGNNQGSQRKGVRGG